MKKFFFFALGVISAFVIVGCSASYTSDSKIVSKVDSISYVMGAYDGRGVVKNMNALGLDTIIDVKKYVQSLFEVAMSGKKVEEPDSSFQKRFSKFVYDLRNNSQQLSNGEENLSFEVPSKSFLDSASVIMGSLDGQNIRNGFEQEGYDSLVVLRLYLEGIRDVTNGRGRIDIDANISKVRTYFDSIQQAEFMAKYGDNLRKGKEFLAVNKGDSDVVETESGLQYKVIVKGNGKKPKVTDRVKVHYTGTLIDGLVFDSSVQRGEPVVFGVNQVIAGWTEALTLMPVGSKWDLFIPYNLAYGERGVGSIPPYSTLLFTVELLGIE